MVFRYVAKIYVDKSEVVEESGDDPDKLYNWMLQTAQGKFGNLSGQIIDNKNGKVVKSFRKCPTE